MLKKITPQWLKQVTKTTRLSVARYLSRHDQASVQLLQDQLDLALRRLNEKVQEQADKEKAQAGQQVQLANQLNALLQEKALWQVEKYFILQEQEFSRKLVENQQAGTQAELQTLRTKVAQLEQELNQSSKVAA